MTKISKDNSLFNRTFRLAPDTQIPNGVVQYAFIMGGRGQVARFFSFAGFPGYSNGRGYTAVFKMKPGKV